MKLLAADKFLMRSAKDIGALCEPMHYNLLRGSNYLPYLNVFI